MAEHTKEYIEQLYMKKALCMTDFLYFTRYFFHARFRPAKFVIGEHHKIISDALNKVLRGEITRLIINIAPRYGKTEMAVVNFIAAGLAINPAAKFIHLSYSDDLALLNSDYAKEITQLPEYQELFPEVQIRKNRDSKKIWNTTKGGGLYATSAGGQVTGFGAGLVGSATADEDKEMKSFFAESGDLFGGALIIDDPIKPDDADNEKERERVNNRWESTIKNRINNRKTPIVIIMQRLHERDLCGYLLEDNKENWTVVSLPCIKDDGTALWEFKHTIPELEALREANQIVFDRQYMQRPMPIEGRLYKTFKTYDVLPPDCGIVKCVIDTADTGKDYLCSIVYMPTIAGYYVLDIYYTPQGMETTEGETAKQLTKYEVNLARIESNNGGRGFARNVERICREMGNTSTAIEWFHQRDNKDVRIFTKAADVQNMIYYPANWEKMFPKFARDVQGYMAAGGNSFDDAPDCLTLIIENEENLGWDMISVER